MFRPCVLCGVFLRKVSRNLVWQRSSVDLGLGLGFGVVLVFALVLMEIL